MHSLPTHEGTPAAEDIIYNVCCSSDDSNKICRSQRSASTRSTSREISASWRCAPRAASQPSFELHNIAASHATLSTQINTRLVHRESPSRHFNQHIFLLQTFPGKRTATAFYVRLDRKPQVLRYVDRISPLRQAQTDFLPRLDRVAWVSFALIHSMCDGAFIEYPSRLLGARATGNAARRRHA